LGRLNYPIVRYGVACSSERPIEDAHSLALAAELRESPAPLIDNLVGELRSVAGEKSNPRILPSRAVFPPADPRIINFPEVAFERNGMVLAFRPSMTMCSEGMRSKLWTAITFCSNNAQPATDLDAEIVERFYAESIPYAESLCNKLISLYESYLIQKNAIDKIRVDYGFKFRGCNTSDNSFLSLLNSLMHPHVIHDSGPGMMPSEGQAEGQGAFREMLRAHAIDSPPPSPTDPPLTPPRWLIYQKGGAIALYSLRYDPHSARFDVFCHNSTSEPNSPTSARSLSRLILDYFASGF